MSDDYALLDATAQAALVAAGELTPTDLVEAAIERAERIDPDLNAVIHPRYDLARAEAPAAADGPFRGVPMLLKDLDGTSAGDPYHAGSKFLRDRAYVADHDSHLTERFREAGFVLIGRTNTPELGLVPSTEPEAYGPTCNPWDVSRTPGGSSGGSAAAVASGIVPVAHAGDGGGSIRIPAGLCGLVGLKPSRGRISVGPDDGEAWSGLVARLAVSRTVRDTAGVLDAVHGMMPGDPYGAPTPQHPYVEDAASDPPRLKIGVMRETPTGAVPVHPDCVEAVDDAAGLLADLGHAVDDSWPAALADPAVDEHFVHLYGVWVAADLANWEAKTGDPVTEADVEPATWLSAQSGQAVTGLQFHGARDYLHAHSRRVARWWADGWDLLLTPTLPEPPPPLGSFSSGDDPLHPLFRSAEFVPFSIPFNITGQPAVSLPLHWCGDGLPIGVQLVAAYGREDLLISVAGELERARPWHDRIPPVHASR